MTTQHRPWSISIASLALCLAVLLFPSAAAYSQLLNVDQEIEVRDLPSVVSPSQHSSDVLTASLTTIFHDREICCGKDSALKDSLERADPKSLQDVAAKLNGRHLLGDGRPIVINATYISAEQANAGYMVQAFNNQHAMLVQWNEHIYVVHGLVYFWMASGGDPETGGAIGTVVRKFLLWDTRYSDSRRQVVFDRDKDDLAKVQGFLYVDVKR